MKIVNSLRPWFEIYDWESAAVVNFIEKYLNEAFKGDVVKFGSNEHFEFQALGDKCFPDFNLEWPIDELEVRGKILRRELWYRRLISFSDSQKDFLKEKFSGTLVVMNEMHPIDEDVFNELGIYYINIFSSPIRFTGFGSLRAVRSNHAGIQELLGSYRYSDFYVNLWASFLKFKFRFRFNSKIKLKVKYNSVLIVGQCRFDYSKYDFQENKFYQLEDYKADVLNITSQYDSVYYTKHPLSKENYDSRFLDEIGAIVLNEVDTYSLIFSGRIKKVVGLSSSVLRECDYFDVPSVRLFGDFVDVDGKFINIKKSKLRSVGFWRRIKSIVETG